MTTASSNTQPALQKLADKLADSAELYALGELEDQRYAVVSQLSDTFDYLINEGIDPRVLGPLMRPFDALNDQYANRLDPLFTERRRAGKPAMSEDQLNRLGTLAALTNLWLELNGSGADTNAQLAAAARKFRGKWFGSVTVSQLKRARMIVSQEADDHSAVRTSKAVTGFITHMIEQHGRGAAIDVVVRHLNDQQPSVALGNWSTIKRG